PAVVPAGTRSRDRGTGSPHCVHPCGRSAVRTAAGRGSVTCRHRAVRSVGVRLVRRLAGGLVRPHLDHRVLRAVDARLRRRGWLAVASLRLIPAVPFSMLNYCSALSSISFRHYLAGTAGIVPGSVAVVVLGDALTGTTSPTLLAVSLAAAAVGMIGLIVEVRSPVI